jgi:hypothetical protein
VTTANVVLSRPMMDNPLRDAARCVWPDCVSTYPITTGPATPGWQTTGPDGLRAVLCPFHADLGHRPRRVPERTVLRAACTCGWPGALVLTSPGAVAAWSEHVRGLQVSRG